MADRTSAARTARRAARRARARDARARGAHAIVQQAADAGRQSDSSDEEDERAPGDDDAERESFRREREIAVAAREQFMRDAPANAAKSAEDMAAYLLGMRNLVPAAAAYLAAEVASGAAAAAPGAAAAAQQIARALYHQWGVPHGDMDAPTFAPPETAAETFRLLCVRLMSLFVVAGATEQAVAVIGLMQPAQLQAALCAACAEHRSLLLARVIAARMAANAPAEDVNRVLVYACRGDQPRPQVAAPRSQHMNTMLAADGALLGLCRDPLLDAEDQGRLVRVALDLFGPPRYPGALPGRVRHYVLLDHASSAYHPLLFDEVEGDCERLTCLWHSLLSLQIARAAAELGRPPLLAALRARGRLAPAILLQGIAECIYRGQPGAQGLLGLFPRPEPDSDEACALVFAAACHAPGELAIHLADPGFVHPFIHIPSIVCYLLLAGADAGARHLQEALARLR